ncbi:hydroxymethylbilane synthase [Verrucomicrobia bacterium]|nr:hydroxymethylbilane synthase [Verrucomicrobiota bacterium]
METPQKRPIIIATRGSALALVQANQIKASCEVEFPDRDFNIQIFKTTGDKLQTASLANPDKSLPKGLFTKELETALLNGEADLAVHSLKDLPTELPEGLRLAATTKREDPRDVLIYSSSNSAGPEPLPMLPEGASVATSSNRRKAQLFRMRPDLQLTEIRGNVGTRLRKLSENPELHATILAAAGLKRLGYTIADDGTLTGIDVPEGIKTRPFSTDEMVPCPGQAAIGIETREIDPDTDEIVAALNDMDTFSCIGLERTFLRTIGGGCSTPTAAYAEFEGEKVTLRAAGLFDEKFLSETLNLEAPEALEATEALARKMAGI